MRNPIEMFFHCRECTLEKPPGMSPATYQNISTGLDKLGNIVVWCERHDEEITTIRKVEIMAPSKN